MKNDTNNKNEWHLRFGVTPNCNFKCLYCNPLGYEWKEHLPEKEVNEILEAAHNAGISRVHWTGGEPTVRKDFTKLVKSAKEIGYTKQIVTTNGSNLYHILDECIENGLTRVIMSLDTLNSDRFKELTGRDTFKNVIDGIEDSVKKLESVTKISAVTMRSTLPELEQFIKYAQDINSRNYKGSLAIKLNQFFPSNPAQLQELGQEYWKKEFVTEKEILDTLSKVGNLNPIQRKQIEGDNPTYNYYTIGDTGVLVGVLTLFSDRYPCGGCHKLRIQPTGKVTSCINIYNQPSLVEKTIEEKTTIIRDMMQYRENVLSKDMPNRKHYRAQLGELRFGKIGEPLSMEFFYNFLNSDKNGS